MKEVKYRHEFKYPITQQQYRIQEAKIAGIAEMDGHTGEKGFYNIRSLYFDDYYNSSYYDNENGFDNREKYRIRIYNHSSRIIKLEVKQKVRGKTYKQACKLSEKQCRVLMEGEIPTDIFPDQKVLYKLAHLMATRLMKPVIIVDYDRVPYVYRREDANVRITFDKNLNSSSEINKFFEPNLQGRPIFSEGNLLMEVKYDDFFPDEINGLLQMKDMVVSTFSKYYLCRKYRG